ncbi:hypothetical protein HZC00_04440 [Candidatus Kaiserbacteria bacterium]|nr:hypothetical protein [Candidatus Kaiserbacteria bacterium]
MSTTKVVIPWRAVIVSVMLAMGVAALSVGFLAGSPALQEAYNPAFHKKH